MKFTNKLWIAILIAGFVIGGIADSFIESDEDGSAETSDASSSMKSNHPIAENFQALAGLCLIASGIGLFVNWRKSKKVQAETPVPTQSTVTATPVYQPVPQAVPPMNTRTAPTPVAPPVSNDPAFKVGGQMLVANLKAKFLERFGVSINVHNGLSYGSYASDTATLASIRSDKATGTHDNLELHGNMLVGTAEDEIATALGFKVQILDRTGKNADNKARLSSLKS